MATDEMESKERESLLELLSSALSDVRNRKEFISRFQNEVWNADDEFLASAAGEVFSDLAHDLEYYEPDPVRQSESGSYFGDERLESLVRKALADLESDVE